MQQSDENSQGWEFSLRVLAAGFIAAMAATACTGKGVYVVTEDWRKETCKDNYSPADPQRERCLEQVTQPYDDYVDARKESETDASPSD